MAVPSRLKEYPEGTTRPTTDFEQPNRSSLTMMRGKATSEEEGPSTSSSSSLRYLRSFQRLKPCDRAISPSTTKTKSVLVRYTHKSSLPSGKRVRKPYLPMVNAMAPNAPRGATRSEEHTSEL